MSSEQTLAQMNLMCMWLAAILYGINCILFGTCVCVISIRSPAHSRLLLCATSFQFAMSTAHVILMFIQAMIAFTNTTIAATPDGANLYYAATGNPIFLAGQLIYIVNSLAQELLLIWRLYVVWNQNFKVCILPLITWVAHCATASVAVALLAPKNASIFSYTFRALSLSGWSLEMILNVTLTAGIVYRIWQTGQQTAALTSGGGFRYKGTIITIVESGALIAACTFVIFCLWAAGNIAGLVGSNIAMQVATMTPLLIIVRGGLRCSHSNLGSYERYSYTLDPWRSTSFVRKLQTEIAQ
ncbi:uncharacterized protein HD556DRAFT_154348 [Suillus plorans]|uniref:Uncharacterized protein n=1 Tax=Suillus plorans TaxID=116603 RepID=A0A9P7DMW1_9AGAM|nr:uncharacterized protein HD556DRAFT_154348 [Suillus plorans]KAG1798828.1 hypothetical protein HD556DRAFT_154348 [Suillus plorans]